MNGLSCETHYVIIAVLVRQEGSFFPPLFFCKGLVSFYIALMLAVQ